MMTAYVARWPLRHVYGARRLNAYFDRTLNQVGRRSIMEIYGLEFRDSATPPRIDDLFLVSVMQGLILLSLIALACWAWDTTNDYVLPGFIIFSVFHVIPSERDFLTSGELAERVPEWLVPFTSALSFVVSLPAMLVALPSSIVWGLIGWVRFKLSKSEMS